MADASAYDSLLGICVSAAVSSIQNMSYEQLSALVNDDAKINEIIDNIPQVKTLPGEREVILAQNKSLAEWNLTQEPKIAEMKRKLLQTYETTTNLKAEIIEGKAKLDQIAEQRSLDTSSALLQAAAQSAEDESEEIADRFINGTTEVEEFLTDFIEKKTLAHMRKIKSEKLLATLRQQHYTLPTTNAQSVPYPVHAPSQNVPGRHSFWS